MNWTLNTKKYSIFYTSLLIGAYGILFIRVFDYLRYLSSVFEAFFIPTISICIGLLVFRKLNLKNINLFNSLILSWILFPIVIYFNHLWTSIIYASLVFVILGGLLDDFSKKINSSSAYAYEISGWLIGVTVTFYLLPKAGAEKIYLYLLLLLFSWRLFLLEKIQKKSILTVIFIFFVILFIQKNADILNIVNRIPSRNPTNENTERNGVYAINNLNAKKIESLWTGHDKIDFIQYQDLLHLYYSNQPWSIVPEDKELQDNQKIISDKALVIGLGGGGDFINLERAGFRNIKGIEIYSDLVAHLKEKYVPLLFSRNIVIAAEARQYLRTTSDKFDLILHSFPDVNTEVAFSGWPVQNSMYTREAYFESYSRLNTNGIFLSRVYYTTKNPWMLQNIVTLRSVSDGLDLNSTGRFAVFESHQEKENSVATRYILALKNGFWSDADSLRVMSIYPDYKLVKTNSKVEDHRNIIVSFAKENIEYLRKSFPQYSYVETDRNSSPIRQIGFNSLKQSVYLILIFLFIFYLVQKYYFFKDIASTSISAFSGYFFSMIQIIYILNLSAYNKNFMQTYILLTSSLMFASLFFNIYILPRIPIKTSFYILSPIISCVFMALYIYLKTHIFYRFTLIEDFICLFVVGFFSTVNFNLVLKRSAQFNLMYSLNLFGYAIGTLVFLVLYRFVDRDSISILFLISSFYGLLISVTSYIKNIYSSH